MNYTFKGTRNWLFNRTLKILNVTYRGTLLSFNTLYE